MKKTNDSENIEFHGTITVLADEPDSGLGDGSLELQGSLFADFISPNTDLTPVNIDNVLVQTGTITMPQQTTIPTAPVLANSRDFYIKDSLLKDIKSDGSITTYQPITTKGDLVSYDTSISTQNRIPVGNPGNLLLANPTVSTGLSWFSKETTFPKGNTITLAEQGNLNPVSVTNSVYSSFFVTVSPFTKNAYSSTFIFSKSNPSTKGNVVKLIGAPAVTTTGELEGIYNEYCYPEIYKTYLTGNGSYLLADSSTYFSEQVTLTGTSWISLGSKYLTGTGAFSVSIYSDSLGSCATFLVCKSIVSSTGAIINKISSSPGATTSNLELRWVSGSSGIEIRKTASGDDGTYNVIDNFQAPSALNMITLNGTASVTMTDKNTFGYQQRSRIIRVYSNTVTDSPCSIFFIAKSSVSITCSSFGLRAPGAITSEMINVSWSANNLITVSKSGANYDGNYNFEMI
jgi:hypothetical protein